MDVASCTISGWNWMDLRAGAGIEYLEVPLGAKSWGRYNLWRPILDQNILFRCLSISYTDHRCGRTHQNWIWAILHIWQFSIKTKWSPRCHQVITKWTPSGAIWT